MQETNPTESLRSMAIPSTTQDPHGQTSRWQTNCSERLEFQSQLGPVADYFVAIYLIIVWIVAIYANGVIIIGLCRQKQQQFALDALMGNLACSNGLLAMLTYPFMVISLMKHRWLFYDIGCYMYSFVTMFFGLVSIWTLLGIAGVLSHTITSKTAKAAKLIQQRQQRYWCIRFLIFIHLVSAFFCTLPLFNIGQYGPGKHGTSCTIAWQHNDLTSTIYITFLMAAGFFTPLLGTAIFYYRITHVLFSMTKTGDVHAQRARRWMAVKRKTLMMSTAVCVCMLVCWTPYSVVAMWETYGDSATLPMELEAVSALLAKSSTALTPLVHLWFTKKFRRWLRVFICYYCIEQLPVDLEGELQSLEIPQPVTLRSGEVRRPRLCPKHLLRIDKKASKDSRKLSFLDFVDVVVNEPVLANRVLYSRDKSVHPRHSHENTVQRSFYL